jgi:hypothetical protein
MATTTATVRRPSALPDGQAQLRLVHEYQQAAASGDHDAAHEAWAAVVEWQDSAAEMTGARRETCEPCPEVPRLRLTAPRRVTRPTRDARQTTSRRTAGHGRRATTSATSDDGGGEPSEPSSPVAAPGVPVEPHAAPAGVTA